MSLGIGPTGTGVATCRGPHKAEVRATLALLILSFSAPSPKNPRILTFSDTESHTYFGGEAVLRQSELSQCYFSACHAVARSPSRTAHYYAVLNTNSVPKLVSM